MSHNYARQEIKNESQELWLISLDLFLLKEYYSNSKCLLSWIKCMPISTNGQIIPLDNDLQEMHT